MLEAVHTIHEEKIVHSDLKPANFVLVRGELKLIDFGIAKAIGNDTTNIQRDQQIGTLNYMSPEAILEETTRSNGQKIMKLGRASDVWSLGCILYQVRVCKYIVEHALESYAMPVIADGIRSPTFPCFVCSYQD